MADDAGYYGTQRPDDTSGHYNALAFVVKQILNGRNFAALVRVSAVNNAAETVDVQPLVNQLDGQGNSIEHGIVNDIPFIRLQGGANAVIIDPHAGDIGLCVFCDRDSSSVQSSRDNANPGSLRRGDMADGVYLGGLLNADPTQYVKFADDGITVYSPYKITLQAPEVDIVAPVVKINASTSTTITTPTLTVNGNMHGTGTITGDVDVVVAGKSVANHYHIAQGATSPTTTMKP